jgi:hypothetical protein
MRVSWRLLLRVLLVVVAAVLLWERFGAHRYEQSPGGVTDLNKTSPLNQPNGGPVSDEAYAVYSALYKEPMDQPLAFADTSVTDIPQVGGSCLKPSTPEERQMTDSFVAANRQTHRWEKKFSIAQGYRLLSTNEVAIVRQCHAEKDVDSPQCKPYAEVRTIRLLGVPGYDQAHSRALVSVIKSCGHLCGSGGIFAVEKSGDSWTRSAASDFTRDCNWMY